MGPRIALTDIAATEQKQKVNPVELAGIFLRLGTTAFGGPAAHIAMMRQEFVERRQWLSEAEFVDLIGASSLLPGPSSTEVAIFIGLRQAGATGLVLAGTCFILPAMLMVMVFAKIYVSCGHLMQSSGILYGIKPVMIAVIAQAIWALGRTALRRPEQIVIAAGALILSFFGTVPILLLFVCGAISSSISWARGHGGQKIAEQKTAIALIAALFTFPLLLTFLLPLGSHVLNLSTLFIVFFKFGSTVFGSGYVLLAYLRDELVTRLHWLTARQLLDSIAVGQFTPGPVFTTATFIGYLLKGPTGAIVATVGIFLPAFVFVAAAGSMVGKIRSSPITGSFLDGINSAAVALMAGAEIELAKSALVDAATIVIALVCCACLFKFRINSTWMVLAGGLAGLLLKLVAAHFAF